MDRDEILDALRAVGQHLERDGLRGDLYVVGGAAIALAYNARRVTRDVDAVFEPKQRIYAAAAAVAEERGLDAGWLNDAVKGFLSGPDPYDTRIFDLPRACGWRRPPRKCCSRSRCSRTGSTRIVTTFGCSLPCSGSRRPIRCSTTPSA